ncbi:hypothetical protein BH11PSE12_BH11PSE12_17280 [soil metagenome]
MKRFSELNSCAAFHLIARHSLTIPVMPSSAPVGNAISRLSATVAFVGLIRIIGQSIPLLNNRTVGMPCLRLIQSTPADVTWQAMHAGEILDENSGFQSKLHH